MASSTGNSRTFPVIAVTGTSGAGKGTLEAAIMPRLPELELAVSATTRERREGEEEGREYYFVTDAEFQRILDSGEFLEHVEQKAIGVAQLRTVSPAQQLVKIVYDELTAMLEKQKDFVRPMHEQVLAGNATCIDCHKGVAHTAPEE